MNSLVHSLRRTIADHVQVASAADILAITSTLCAAEPRAESPSPAAVHVQPRFQVHGDVVTDALTGLMWTRENVPGAKRNWSEAKKAAAAITTGGHSDWRLPTIRELLTLVDYERSDPAIDTDVFKCESAWYWSLTPYQPSPGGCAWIVYFSGGYSYWGYQHYEGFVRAVRVGQLIGTLA
jgi:hypothetical protein